MKCLILAGGKGNGLWPLSREDYPKQFMNIKENRSLLQETIARNLPFCDEFLIVTNENYHFIVEGQLKVFQGLQYRYFLEEVPRGTTAAIALTCLCERPSELVFVVTADQLMEEGDYKEAVVRAQELAGKGGLVTFGVEPNKPHTGYGYMKRKGEEVVSFQEKPDKETAAKYLDEGGYLWNTGNFLFSADAFLNELRVCSPDVYESCIKAKPHIKKNHKHVRFTKQAMNDIPSISVEYSVFEKSNRVKVVPLYLKWCDVGNLETLDSFIHKKDKENVVESNCEGLTVINRAENRLVVANEVKNLVVVNTEDALYISNKGQSERIKEIMNDNRERYGHYFEKNPLHYRPWGNYEVLKDTMHYKVKRATVYPGRSQNFHKHNLRSEHWSVVKGTATITIGRDTKEYQTNEGVYVPIGMSHKVENKTEEDVVIVEVSIGTVLTEEDTIRIEEGESDQNKGTMEIMKMEPAYKDYLWGGTRLRDVYHKKCDYDRVAESWELSAHKDGSSVIASGEYKGMSFDEYVKRFGKRSLGWKCETFDAFPVLIKFIDAKKSLSIQVHPDDEFALKNENEFGKNEIWYIVDCEEGASIYYGVKKRVSKEELEERIENNTVLEVLNEIKVKKGDVFFVEAGTIHAIGKGIFICEIQQSSNCTYRLYDYARKDQSGNYRELHLEKALDVASLKRVELKSQVNGELVKGDGYTKQVLGRCKYFESTKFEIEEEMTFSMDDSSFYSIIVIEGKGIVSSDSQSLKFQHGDSVFIPAGEKRIQIIGKCTIIITHV